LVAEFFWIKCWFVLIETSNTAVNLGSKCRQLVLSDEFFNWNLEVELRVRLHQTILAYKINVVEYLRSPDT
jgi:hypothetical protein